MSTNRLEHAAHLLIIDDDDPVRESLVAWFEQSGFRVSEARSGAEALALLAQERPDLALCDLNMPGMHGLQLLAKVTRNYPALPFIIISGKGDMGDVIQALKLGAWDYVTKPVTDLEVLEHSIGLALERAQLRRDKVLRQRELETANQRLSEALRQRQDDEAAGRALQFELLPEKGRRFGPMQLDYFIKPSSALSGDFIDYFAIDHCHTGFYLADVSGHGISSALITAMLKNAFQRYLQDCWQGSDKRLLDPSETLAGLNAQFVSSGVSKHLTLFYGRLNIDTGELLYASAGHYPRAIVGTADQCQFEGYASPPLGLFADAEYPNARSQVCDNGFILLSSDGIFDALPQQHLNDKEAAMLNLARIAPLGINAICDKLGLVESAPELPDDLTLLLIKRLSNDSFCQNQ